MMRHPDIMLCSFVYPFGPITGHHFRDKATSQADFKSLAVWEAYRCITFRYMVSRLMYYGL